MVVAVQHNQSFLYWKYNVAMCFREKILLLKKKIIHLRITVFCQREGKQFFQLCSFPILLILGTQGVTRKLAY